MKRELTHRLYFIKERDRWVCGCGFVLGNGHASLYARCKMFGKKTAYHENKISSAAATKHEKKPPSKVQRQTRSTGAGVSQKAFDLFDL